MEIGIDNFAAILPDPTTATRLREPIAWPIFLKRSRSPIKLGSTCSVWANTTGPNFGFRASDHFGSCPHQDDPPHERGYGIERRRPGNRCRQDARR